MDIKIYMAQQWLNATYRGRNGYNEIQEDGLTGWSTIHALTRALQIELGISVPSDNFGTQTMGLCPTLSIDADQSLIVDSNIVKILQSAMFCKGYSPGDITGNFGVATKAGIQQMQSDAGLLNLDGIVTPLIFKSLLSMDAYVLISGGDSNIRKIQMNLNKDYYPAIGGLIPCDGIYGRTTNKAMILAIQIEGGIPEPNGVWGPATIASLPVLTYGNTKRAYNYLLQYALYVNGFSPNGFDGYFGNGCNTAVRNFQTFCALSVDGVVGSQTWASLMISKGDTNRKGTACDTRFEITPARAQTLYNNGYRIVGRYLTGGDFKQIRPGEIQTILNAGLSIFPIYQSSGNTVSYFNYNQGKKDALQAILSAKKYGFKTNTIIYFAVDFDAMDHQVTNNIIPYFNGINNQFSNMNSDYRIGIYGARNICSRVALKGYSCSSFVADMSTGFSGNLGYSLPNDWNFDQILEYSIGSGDGNIAIDKDICRGNYKGESSVSTPTNIIEIANNLNGLGSMFGVTYTGVDLEIPILNTPLLTITAKISVSASTTPDVGTGIQFANGNLDGFDAQFNEIAGSFNIDSVSLAAKLSELNNVEFWIGATTTPNGSTIDLINIFEEQYAGIGYIEETLSIKFKNITLDTVEEAVEDATESVISFGEEYPLVIPILIVAGIVVIATLGLEILTIEGILAAITAITSGLSAFVLFIIQFFSRLLPLAN